MHDHDIFAALAQMRRRALALACATRELVPQLEDDLQRLEACCAGAGPGRAFARALMEELARPVRQVLRALGDFADPFEDLPADSSDYEPRARQAAEQPAGGIHFERFSKLKEFSVMEKAIEMVAPLRDKSVAGLLRLEALRAPRETGYLVAVYYRADVPVPLKDHEGTVLEGRRDSAHVWAQYDLIHSNLPTAEKALEQALAFLEMRCD